MHVDIHICIFYADIEYEDDVNKYNIIVLPTSKHTEVCFLYMDMFRCIHYAHKYVLHLLHTFYTCLYLLQDIVNEPHLLIDGMSKDDIKQGTLGDCWFLSSCAAVSREERFMRRVRIYLYFNRRAILVYVADL